MRDPDLPAHDELADDEDELDWRRDVIGTPDEVVAQVPAEDVTVAPYDPGADPFLREG